MDLICTYIFGPHKRYDHQQDQLLSAYADAPKPQGPMIDQSWVNDAIAASESTKQRPWFKPVNEPAVANTATNAATSVIKTLSGYLSK
jgi:hypothetical protein